MSQNEIEQIEMSIEVAREMVLRGELAEKLAENPEFKKIVMQGYFVDEGARLALLSSDPSISEDIRGHVMRDMAGVGAFKRYMQTLVQMGRIAAAEIREANEALDEIRAEELEEASE